MRQEPFSYWSQSQGQTQHLPLLKKPGFDKTNLVAALTLTDSERGEVTESEATYYNPVIRAQRLSDGELKSFPAAGLKAALEAWAGSSSVAAQAYDASGNGNDFLQATVDSQPLVVDSGTVITDANGNLGLYHGDGSFQLIGPDSGLTPASGVTIFSAIRAKKAADLAGTFGGIFWSITNNGAFAANRVLLFRQTGGDNLQVFLENVAGTNTYTASFSNFFQTYDNETVIITVLVKSGELLVYVNGVLTSPSSTSGTYDNDVTASYFHSGGYGDGGAVGSLDQAYIHGHYVYNADKSSDLASIHAALQAEYGI